MNNYKGGVKMHNFTKEEFFQAVETWATNREAFEYWIENYGSEYRLRWDRQYELGFFDLGFTYYILNKFFQWKENVTE